MRFKNSSFLFALLFLLCLFASGVHAEVHVTTVTATSDSYITNASSTTNYGWSTYLPVGLFDGTTVQRALIYFDISGTESNYSVLGATLSLYGYTGETTVPFRVFRVTTTWQESYVSWEVANSSDIWTVPGGDIDTVFISTGLVSGTTAQWHHMDVTGLFRNWYYGVYPNNGIQLRYGTDIIENGLDNQATFYSKDAESSWRPKIKVRYVEPLKIVSKDFAGFGVDYASYTVYNSTDGIYAIGQTDYKAEKYITCPEGDYYVKVWKEGYIDWTSELFSISHNTQYVCTSSLDYPMKVSAETQFDYLLDFDNTMGSTTFSTSGGLSLKGYVFVDTTAYIAAICTSTGSLSLDFYGMRRATCYNVNFSSASIFFGDGPSADLYGQKVQYGFKVSAKDQLGHIMDFSKYPDDTYFTGNSGLTVSTYVFVSTNAFVGAKGSGNLQCNYCGMVNRSCWISLNVSTQSTVGYGVSSTTYQTAEGLYYALRFWAENELGKDLALDSKTLIGADGTLTISSAAYSGNYGYLGATGSGKLQIAYPGYCLSMTTGPVVSTTTVQKSIYFGKYFDACDYKGGPLPFSLKVNGETELDYGISLGTGVWASSLSIIPDSNLTVSTHTGFGSSRYVAVYGVNAGTLTFRMTGWVDTDAYGIRVDSGAQRVLFLGDDVGISTYTAGKIKHGFKIDAWTEVGNYVFLNSTDTIIGGSCTDPDSTGTFKNGSSYATLRSSETIILNHTGYISVDSSPTYLEPDHTRQQTVYFGKTGGDYNFSALKYYFKVSAENELDQKLSLDDSHTNLVPGSGISITTAAYYAGDAYLSIALPPPSPYLRISHTGYISAVSSTTIIVSTTTQKTVLFGTGSADFLSYPLKTTAKFTILDQYSNLLSSATVTIVDTDNIYPETSEIVGEDYTTSEYHVAIDSANYPSGFNVRITKPGYISVWDTNSGKHFTVSSSTGTEQQECESPYRLNIRVPQVALSVDKQFTVNKDTVTFTVNCSSGTNLAVTVDVSQLDSTKTTVPALDNGVPPDATINDGIYTVSVYISSTNARADGAKTITAKAVDSYTNEATDTVSITLDNTAPSPPSVVSSSSHPGESTWYNTNNVTLSWSIPSDVSGISGYHILLDSKSLTVPTISDGFLQATTTSFANVTSGVNYFHIVAKDNMGNVGITAKHYTLNIDTIVPQAVTTLTALSQAGGVIYLSWTAPSDGEAMSGVASYKVMRSSTSSGTGSQISPAGYTNTYYTDSGAENLTNTTYYYTVRPVDVAGNTCANGNNKASALCLKSASPPAVSSSNFPSQTVWYSTNTASVSWTPPTIYITGYYFALDQSPNTIPSPSDNYTTLNSTGIAISSDGTWYFHIISKDYAGNVGTVASHYTLKSDITKPSPPSVLSSSSHPGETTWYNNNNVTISWSAASDASGIAGYHIALDSIPTTVPTGSSASTQDTTISTTTTEGVKYFHIVSKDNAGNIGTSVKRLIIRVGTAPLARVTGITPSYGTNISSTSVVIAGTGFISATRVKLDDPSSTQLGNMVVNSDISISATVPADIAIGSWNVLVTNQNGTNEKSDELFTVMRDSNDTSVQEITAPADSRTSVLVGPGTFAVSVTIEISTYTLTTESFDEANDRIVPFGSKVIFPDFLNDTVREITAKDILGDDVAFESGKTATVTIPYAGIDNESLENIFRLYKIKEIPAGSGEWQWVLLASTPNVTANTVTGTVDGFSIFKIGVMSIAASSADPANITVYPNPYVPDTAVRGTLKFEGLAENSRIKIYNIAGELVADMEPGTSTETMLNPGNTGRAEWKGVSAAHGLYIYVILDADGNKYASGKFGIKR